MRKTVGSICLIAGTAIGAGMVALPMTMAKLGLFQSFALMLVIWFAMYYSALINIELNLRADEGLSLGRLGKLFSGIGSYLVGDISLMLLCYSLLSAYIYGCSSTIVALLATFSIQSDHITVTMVYSAIVLLILSFSIHKVDSFNQALFLIMLIVIGLFIAALICGVDLGMLPMIAPINIASWNIAIPVLFTSFGFQVIFHTLTTYCNKDAKKLRIVFFWGSLIPAIVYTIWITCTLGVLYKANHDFFNCLISGQGVEVGDFIDALGEAAGVGVMKALAWIISILAIFTSTIGVGLGLIDILKCQIIKHKPPHVLMVACAILPAAFVALIVPNAFIHALSFAGMILAVIAIILPVYLHWKSKEMGRFYDITHNISLQVLIVMIAIIIIICEINNLT